MCSNSCTSFVGIIIITLFLELRLHCLFACLWCFVCVCDTVKIQLLSVAPDQKWRNVTYRGPDRAMKGVLGTLCHMIVVRGVSSKSLLFAWVCRDLIGPLLIRGCRDNFERLL